MAIPAGRSGRARMTGRGRFRRANTPTAKTRGPPRNASFVKSQFRRPRVLVSTPSRSSSRAERSSPRSLFGAIWTAGTVSNTFVLEWPKGSGNFKEYPEIDREGGFRGSGALQAADGSTGAA